MAKALDSSTTMAPKGASIAYDSTTRKRLTRGEWELLAQDLYQSINAALGERGALEQNLKDWTDLYEMRVDEIDWPWVNASNVFIPVIPAQVDTALAYIAGKVFVPRFYLCSGNTEDAAATAHQVERYYDAELRRQRGQTTWYDQYITWLHLALRDGTSVMEVLWRKTISNRKVVTFVPETDADGTPIMDETTGRVRQKREIHEVKIKEYDDVELQPVLLRDFLIIPDEADSIENAVAVARATFLMESDLQQMIQDGVLDAEQVEFALTYVDHGTTNDYASDRQGNEDRTAGDQLVIGNSQGALVSKFFKNRGPIKVWRIHSKQYDMNGDGIAEENIFWLHELSQRMLGWTAYEYIVPGNVRPFFSLTPWPRPNRFYGYSLVERLAPIQAEINGMYNQRNNLISLMLSPPLLYTDGDVLADNQQQWGPGVQWKVGDPDKSVKWLNPPAITPATFQNEGMLNQYVDKLTGLSGPSMGTQQTGRRSAAENKLLAAGANVRNDLVSSHLRNSCRSIYNFIHALKLQYTDNDPNFIEGGQKFTIPREILAKDYQLDIAGASDPVDSDSRRTETLGLFQLLSQVPFIAQDQVKTYNLVRVVLEAFNRADTVALIGTQQDAEQRAQAQAQQQQMAQKLQVAQMLMGGQQGQQQKPHSPQQGKPAGSPK